MVPAAAGPARALSAPHRDRLARQFADEPAYAYVGLVLTKLEAGLCCSRTPVRAELLHHRGAVQGGLVAMIADATAGYAALATLDGSSRADDMATVEFKTSFFRPVVATAVLCRADVIHAGRSTVFCRARVFADVETPERLCAEATLTFKRLSASGVMRRSSSGSLASPAGPEAHPAETA